jgi:exodeoxyribonuclease VII large subunit
VSAEPHQEPLPGVEAAGIEGFPGPFAVGRYAREFRDRLRGMSRVCIVGEVVNAKTGGSGANVYFELRDAEGAMRCAMWRNEFERSGMRPEDLRDGVQVVAAGGPDYYTGGANASPSFSFRVADLRLAGEGDLLVKLDRLRRELAAEGLFEPQKLLARPLLPRSIGVVTAEGSAARRDFLAGLERRSWRGRIVWGYAPVQDKRAAPAIRTAIADLAATGGVDVIVVTRGGGSIADLWAFCDEALCRTVAMLPVPVISAVGHDVDSTLIDDVAAVCCSTPTHAAEAAVGIDCAVAAKRLRHAARRLDSCGRAAVVRRARELGGLSRAPREHLDRHRRQLRQMAREVRASGRRGVGTQVAWQERVAAVVLGRKRDAAAAAAAAEHSRVAARAARLERAAAQLAERRTAALAKHTASLFAHDPERTLERGYALLLGESGEPLGSGAAVREAGAFTARMSDADVRAKVDE